MLHQAGSVLPSWTTNESYSKPPTPPPPEDDHLGQHVTHAQMRAKSETHSEYGDGKWNTHEQVGNVDVLEAKRRAAVREREREQAAKQRHRFLLAEKREAEIKRREAEERGMVENHERRAERMMAEAKEREQRREVSIRGIEESEKRRAEDIRRQYQVERKRESALQALEMNRLREEEAQRIKRESILKKRTEMERVRDETERVSTLTATLLRWRIFDMGELQLYQKRKQEEMQRKVELVEEMQKKRGERLADLERRRTNPLLLQQEKEFNQLIEIHAALGRLQLKTEQTQARREDVRERLLESRHLTSVLENEESQLTLSLHEVEADVKKLEGYQSSLEKLVSTRYDEAEYDPAVTKLQALWRGRKTRVECTAKTEATEAFKKKQAAVAIQKRQRGVMVRRQMRDEQTARAMVHGAIKIQAFVRGCQTRTKVVAWKRALAKAMIETEKERLHDKSTLIQCAFRNHLAKKKFRVLLLRKIKKIQRDGIEPYKPKKGLRGPQARGGAKPRVARDNSKQPNFIARKAPVRQTFPTKPAPQVQRGEMHRIYVDGMHMPGRRVEKQQVQTRFSAMGSLIAHKPSPPPREVIGHRSPYSQSPRRFIPAYPTAVMAEIEPQKLFNYLPVMDAGWGNQPAADKMAYWHDAAPVQPQARKMVPTGVPYGGRALPAESMMLRI